MPEEKGKNPRHTESTSSKQASPPWLWPQVAEKPSSTRKLGHLTPAPWSVPCHQLIMLACLFIYWLYKKPNALLTGRQKMGSHGGGGREGLTRRTPLPQASAW